MLRTKEIKPGCSVLIWADNVGHLVSLSAQISQENPNDEIRITSQTRGQKPEAYQMLTNECLTRFCGIECSPSPYPLPIKGEEILRPLSSPRAGVRKLEWHTLGALICKWLMESNTDRMTSPACSL